MLRMDTTHGASSTASGLPDCADLVVLIVLMRTELRDALAAALAIDGTKERTTNSKTDIPTRVWPENDGSADYIVAPTAGASA